MKNVVIERGTGEIVNAYHRKTYSSLAIDAIGYPHFFRHIFFRHGLVGAVIITAEMNEQADNDGGASLSSTLIVT